ncbi:betaine/proline/choline family ABC transporter ATP-binding protein [Sedimentimonas flavescens]|uniref:Quaternary amine transport ATP-binding protein n=1 Tax=Sedimentimonas flavescens TaxID=2851012 RepID=A0ABT3A157_9RHOB|nr:betaine/proline/choline family ABC transporter ATP-binding protein [Sedimentimonas flavescens]MCV2879315.1 betaine/proline/choline family ABC transporter ATP-binding protein [Sedimentimonas flavescens]
MTNEALDILIDCRNVWKIFGERSDEAIKAIRERGAGKREVLRDYNCVVGVSDASFQIRKGEIFCIMGLSGSGKSTLVRLLNRLIEPSMGKVEVKGRDIAQMGPKDLRALRAHEIGMVFQSVALIPGRTVLDNAAFGLEVQGVAKAERHQIASDALARVGLADWANHMPRQLSGGMQQRVGLARAIASDPEIILMDEPFSALDPLIRKQLQDEFRELTKSLGKSAVFITHDLDEAMRIGDRIAIMKDGIMIQQGTAEEIVLHPADAYVAEFVAGISRLHLVKAHSLMAPVSAVPEDVRARLPRTSPEADVQALIDLVLSTPDQAVAVEDAGTCIGVVTARTLLEGIRGEEHAPATIEAVA